MYSIGESFVYEFEDEEKQLGIVGDIVIKGKEYIIGVDDSEGYYVFCYNDEEEELVFIDDHEESDLLIKEWQEEYYGTIDEVSLWEEDYDERDEIETEEASYYDEDNYDDEDEEDMDSYIDGLMEDDR